MHKRYLLALYRLLFAALAFVAVGAQFFISLHRTGFSPVNFFSFFTIESNVLAALVFVVSGLAIWRDSRPRWLDMVRGAATVYMATTCIVYTTLLSGLEDSLQTATPWVNVIVHQVFPIAVVADWIIDRSRTPISIKRSLMWLIFPVLYVAYTLIRGRFATWYPYPFLNPILHSYGHVVVMCGVVGIAIYVICIVVARLSPTARVKAKNVRPKRVTR